MTTTQRSTTAAALVLSLAAAGAPTATASQTDGNRATAANQAPATVYSRPDKSVIRVTTPDNGGVYSRPDKSLVRVAPSDDGGVAQAASVPQAVVRIQTPTSGFDWGVRRHRRSWRCCDRDARRRRSAHGLATAPPPQPPHHHPWLTSNGHDLKEQSCPPFQAHHRPPTNGTPRHLGVTPRVCGVVSR
jgi:hypothetical protein